MFVCELSFDTPGLNSEAAAELPDSQMRFSRTQHGRPAVSFEPPVIHNEWEKGNIGCFLQITSVYVGVVVVF